MPFALLDQAEQNASPGKVGYFLRIPSPFFMAYARRYLRFPSQILGREMEMLHFGHHGYPLICLPTSNGRFFDVEDRGIIASLSHHLEQGYLQAFCVETLDWETLFNRQLDLPQRWDRWLLLEQHWVEELIPYAKAEAQNEFLVVAGFSLGATHAVNLTCRHPGLVRRCLALGGPYDVAALGSITGWDPQRAEQELYFINPLAYMSNMSRQLWDHLGGRNTELKLLTARHDHCLSDNLRLAEVLSRNDIPHQLEVWEGNHDWPTWQAQIRAFA